MARAMVTLTAEIDLVRDAVDDIERIMRAIVRFHGRPYRELERRIERLASGEADFGEARMHDLGGGILVFEPWPEMKAIVREARELGVLR